MHAFLSASNYSWINYDNEKIENVYRNHIAILRGTERHDLARRLIEDRITLPNTNDTFNRYVNDAIRFRMTPEIVLFYSKNCYGTTDAIHFDEKKNFLRIHDLKTGETVAKMDQLEIYTALFCLEYDKDISKLQVELRIYQSEKVKCRIPDPKKIKMIQGKIIAFDKIIDKILEEEK